MSPESIGDPAPEHSRSADLPLPRGMTMSEAAGLFEILANYTYDWETWFSHTGAVRWINPAVERMTAYSPAECLAMADYPLPLIHEQDREAFRALLASALSGSSGNDVEFRFLRKDGSFGWGAVSWQPVRAEGVGSLGFRTSIRDITKRKSAEDALRLAKAESEKANLDKSRFLASVSHDLRQPLQAISMYVGALRHRLEGEKERMLLDDVRLCLANCNELLDDLVDISKLDAGVVVAQPKDFALADVFETIETSFRSSAREKGLDLRVVATSLYVHCDLTMLTRILQNLVSNAIRYTETGRVLVGCRRRGDKVALEVWDTGIGISEDQLEHVFEEFFQIGNPGRDRRRGIGLGLAIVRRQARLMGTEVAVRSTPGKGSVFRVEVPLATSVSPVTETEPAICHHSIVDGLSIVVIDDEPVQLDAIASFLTINRAKVIAAASAEDALRHLDDPGASRLSVIVADYRLADGTSGVQAIAAIRERLGARVPAIIITGDIEPQRIADTDASGCVLLHKPVEPATLLKFIAECVD